MILSKMSEFQQRLIMSLVGVVFVLTALCLSQMYFFQPIFVLITALIIAVAVWEYYRIAQMKGFKPLVKVGIGCTLFYAAAVYLSLNNAFSVLPQIVLLSALLLAFLTHFTKGMEPFVNLSITFFGIVYLTIPLTCIININYFVIDGVVQDGRWWLFYLLAVTKATDVGAFFVGKYFGQRQLCPYISPKKTWEGAYGGFCAALVISLLLYVICVLLCKNVPYPITFGQSIWLAACVSVLAQIGDLAESLLKRDMGAKDSNQLPGLGGVLDIVDSLVFTAPLVYIFLRSQSGGFL